MSKAAAIADRLSAPTIGLIALAHMLFVLSFVVLLMISAGQVRAGELVSCGGKNLIEELKRSDAAQLQEIRAEAERIPNGHGLLWRVEKDGIEPSFLFGTMHLSDHRVTSLPPLVKDAFDKSETVIVETTDVLDNKKMASAMLQHMDLTMISGDQTLRDMLEPRQLAIVETELEKRGIMLSSVIKMQPWMLISVVALPECEHQRRKQGLTILDTKLAREAVESGKKLGGLETTVDQLKAMASLPAAIHIEGLVHTLQLGPERDDVFETMIELYSAGDLGMIRPLLNRKYSERAGTDGFDSFDQIMITKRNYGMAANSVSYLNEGRAFIAVGALHLPGEEGLIELLRAKGYRLTPL